jgi:hypothetical protein
MMETTTVDIINAISPEELAAATERKNRMIRALGVGMREVIEQAAANAFNTAFEKCKEKS